MHSDQVSKIKIKKEYLLICIIGKPNTPHPSTTKARLTSFHPVSSMSQRVVLYSVSESDPNALKEIRDTVSDALSTPPPSSFQAAL